MKRTTIFFLMVLWAQFASAQIKGFSIGPYIEGAWPTGNFKKMNGSASGIGITADINLPGRWSATGSAGYLHFRKLDDHPEYNSKAINALPLRAGLKYKLPIVYFKTEAGSAKFLNGENASFLISPGLGVRLLGLDIQGNYETWIREKSTNFWSLRLAYHF